MSERALGLDRDIALEIIHLKYGLGGVADAPDDGRADLHRVAAFVVDLQRRRIEIARAQRQPPLAVERESPAQAFVAVGTDVLAEQGEDRAFIGLQHEQAAQAKCSG